VGKGGGLWDADFESEKDEAIDGRRTGESSFETTISEESQGRGSWAIITGPWVENALPQETKKKTIFDRHGERRGTLCKEITVKKNWGESPK